MEQTVDIKCPCLSWKLVWGETKKRQLSACPHLVSILERALTVVGRGVVYCLLLANGGAWSRGRGVPVHSVWPMEVNKEKTDTNTNMQVSPHSLYYTLAWALSSVCIAWCYCRIPVVILYKEQNQSEIRFWKSQKIVEYYKYGGEL